MAIYQRSERPGPRCEAASRIDQRRIAGFVRLGSSINTHQGVRTEV